MKLKLVLLLVGGLAVMFVLGWVPTVEVRNGDTFEVSCRACSRALTVGWGAVESESTDAGHQTDRAVSPSGGAWSGSARGLETGGPSANDQRSDVMNPNSPQYQSAIDNRSNQLNPNNPAYRSSRGQ
jgi:hypothetical protein